MLNPTPSPCANASHSPFVGLIKQRSEDVSISSTGGCVRSAHRPGGREGDGGGGLGDGGGGDGGGGDGSGDGGGGADGGPTAHEKHTRRVLLRSVAALDLLMSVPKASESFLRNIFRRGFFRKKKKDVNEKS